MGVYGPTTTVTGPVLEGRMKELAQDYQDMTNNEFLKAYGMSKAEAEQRFGLKPQARPGHKPTDTVHESHCNMTEAGVKCPVHGLEECWGQGVYERNELGRMKELAGIKKEENMNGIGHFAAMGESNK
jgi:hypothetical protein